MMNLHLDFYPKDITKTPLETCFYIVRSCGWDGVQIAGITTTKRSDKFISYQEVLSLNKPFYALTNKNMKKTRYKTQKGLINRLKKELK